MTIRPGPAKGAAFWRLAAVLSTNREQIRAAPQAKRLSNILYDARWALAAALIGIPLLVGILRAIGGL